MNPKTNTYVKKSLNDMLIEGREDPVKFAWYFMGIDLHPAQREFLRNSIAPGIKEANLSAGNRFGKGEAIAVKALYMPFYQMRNPKFAYDAQGKLRDYTAINISISLDQASIVFNKAAGYAQNGRLSQYIENIKNSPFPELTFRPLKGRKQGAQLWARSTAFGAKYLLGQNFQYLNFDEASLEPNGEIIMNDVIRMRMADSGGTIDTTSQPRGKNWFYHHFLRGWKDSVIKDAYCYSQYGSSFDNPHIDHDHVKRSMQFMTQSQIEENIYGHFSDRQQFFPADRIQACYVNQDYPLPVPPFYDIIKKKLKDGHEYQDIQPNAQAKPVYVMGVDLANVHDQTCIVVLRIDTNPWQMVYFELLGKMDWKPIKQRITKVHKEYRAWGYVDSTGGGQPIANDLVVEYNNDLEGLHFTDQVKQTLLYELQMAIQNREFVFPYRGQNEEDSTRALVYQLTNYELKDKNLKTDAVFGLALAVKAARDTLERQSIPPIYSFDEPLVIAHRDPRTGSYNFSTIDEDDFDDQVQTRSLSRWTHLVDF